MLVNCAQGELALTKARLAFPAILRLGIGDRLPLEIESRIGSATGERHDVVFPIAGTSAPSPPGRRAWVLPLKLAGYRTGSVLAR
jgi:hypothetical protein